MSFWGFWFCWFLWFIFFFFFEGVVLRFFLNLLLISVVLFFKCLRKFVNLGFVLNEIIFFVYFVYLIFINCGSFLFSFFNVFVWFKLLMYLGFMFDSVLLVIFKWWVNLSKFVLFVCFKGGRFFNFLICVLVMMWGSLKFLCKVFFVI